MKKKKKKLQPILKDELVSYNDRKCIFCDHVHVASWLIDMRTGFGDRQFIACQSCVTEFRKITKD